jgi:antirestriction protein ArdC
MKEQDEKKKTVYDIVTEKILSRMEEGVIPWHMPWKMPAGCEEGYYRNGVTKYAYSGVNAVLLAMGGYSCRDFWSFKQLSERGWKVKEGEKANMAIFWKRSMYKKELENEETGEIEEFEKQGLILRYYSVFNSQQIEGIPEEKLNDSTPQVEGNTLEIKPCERADAMIAGYEDGPEIIEDAIPRAYYSDSKDIVHMPNRSSFLSNEEWYATLFHELTHSTGKATRLGRENHKMYSYGKKYRAREELTAEIGASFCCAMSGIDMPVFENSVAYLQSWSKALKDDPKCTVLAAQAAQKAVNWMKGDREAQRYVKGNKSAEKAATAAALRA